MYVFKDVRNYVNRLEIFTLVKFPSNIRDKMTETLKFYPPF